MQTFVTIRPCAVRLLQQREHDVAVALFVGLYGLDLRELFSHGDVLLFGVVLALGDDGISPVPRKAAFSRCCV